MIFFFHHYELQALLEQIRHQQQQQHQMPPHQDQQAADGHLAPDNNAQLDDDSDQSGSDRSGSTEAEDQGVSDGNVNVNGSDLLTADAHSMSNQSLSVDRTEHGPHVDVTEHTVHPLQMSHNIGVVDNALRQSAASASLTPLSATDEDGRCHHLCACAADTEETRVQSDVLLPSHSIADNAADVGRLPAPAAGSSTELRRRCPVSNSTSPCGSHEAFADHQDCQELCTNRPGSGLVMTDGSLADVSQNGNNILSSE